MVSFGDCLACFLYPLSLCRGDDPQGTMMGGNNLLISTLKTGTMKLSDGRWAGKYHVTVFILREGSRFVCWLVA